MLSDLQRQALSIKMVINRIRDAAGDLEFMLCTMEDKLPRSGQALPDYPGRRYVDDDKLSF
jgi:hypothetical protein